MMMGVCWLWGEGKGRNRNTWQECVRRNMDLLDLKQHWTVNRDVWRDLIWGKLLTLDGPWMGPGWTLDRPWMDPGWTLDGELMRCLKNNTDI